MGDNRLDFHGQHIRQARKAAGMNQTELARKVGVSLTTVCNWERGKSRPSFTSLTTLSRVLNRDVSWLMGESEDPVRGGGACLTVQKIDELMALLGEARKRALEGPPGAAVAEQGQGSVSIGVLRSSVSRMTRFPNLPLRVEGVAAADGQEGQEFAADAVESGTTAGADAEDPRLIAVRGNSATDFARDGQMVVIDAAYTNVGAGDVCALLTRDGNLRLKRKLPEQEGNRRYESINPAYPVFVVPARQVVSEFPVCGVLTKTRLRTPVETLDEGPPPA